jgi:hypothetical protein
VKETSIRFPTREQVLYLPQCQEGNYDSQSLLLNIHQRLFSLVDKAERGVKLMIVPTAEVSNFLRFRSTYRSHLFGTGGIKMAMDRKENGRFVLGFNCETGRYR